MDFLDGNVRLKKFRDSGHYTTNYSILKIFYNVNARLPSNTPSYKPEDGPDFI